MSKIAELPKVEDRPPLAPRAGDETFLRRIYHAARVDVLTIPRPLLHRLGLRRGDLMIVWQEGETICMRSVKLDRLFFGEVKQ